MAQQVLQPGASYFSIDVEAVATGTTHNDRAVAQISLVDQNEQVRMALCALAACDVLMHTSPMHALTPPAASASHAVSRWCSTYMCVQRSQLCHTCSH